MTAVSGGVDSARRVARALRRHGAAGALRRAWALREHDIWFALDLGGERPRRSLPDGMELRRGGATDLPRLEGLVHYRRAEALARLALPARLHLVTEGDEVLFVCWVFPRATPLGVAPDGTLELPTGVACLEDSVAAPAARGRGIAPAAWALIADDLAAEGFAHLVTKVQSDNDGSRRAVRKAGFVEVAEALVSRTGPLWRARVQPLDAGLGAELARRLER